MGGVRGRQSSAPALIVHTADDAGTWGGVRGRQSSAPALIVHTADDAGTWGRVRGRQSSAPALIVHTADDAGTWAGSGVARTVVRHLHDPGGVGASDVATAGEGERPGYHATHA